MAPKPQRPCNVPLSGGQKLKKTLRYISNMLCEMACKHPMSLNMEQSAQAMCTPLFSDRKDSKALSFVQRYTLLTGGQFKEVHADNKRIGVKDAGQSRCSGSQRRSAIICARGKAPAQAFVSACELQCDTLFALVQEQ